MALRQIKDNIMRMFNKNLADLVRGLRNSEENEVRWTEWDRPVVEFWGEKTPQFQFDLSVTLLARNYLVSGQIHRSVYGRNQARTAARECGGQSDSRG